MSSVKKNFAYQTIYEFLIIMLPFVTSPYISRVLGAEMLGKYSYTYSVANFFVIFAMLGIKNYGNRLIAMVRDDRDELNKVFSSIFCLHALVSILSICLYIFYISYVVEADFIYALIQIIFVISALFDINWFFFGMEKFKLTVTRNSIIKILTVFLIFIFVKTPSDLWIYILIMTSGAFISQSIVWLYLKRYVTFVKPNLGEVKKHIKPMLVLFIPVLAISLYKYMGKIMLGTMGTKTELGFFDNAEKVINIPLTIITAFGTVMLPRISNLVANGEKKQTNRYMLISMQWVLWFGIALTFGIAGVADVFAPIFWGEEFKESGILIMLFSISIPFIAFANIIRTQYLIPTHKDRKYISSILVGAIINIILNIILIPSFQAIGAVIAAVCAEASVCIVQVFVVRKDLAIKKYILSFVFFFIPGILMFFSLKIIENLMQPTVFCLIVQLIVGFLIYIVISLIYFILTKNEIVLNLFRKRKKSFK